MYRCPQHGAHSYVPTMFVVMEIFTAARIWKYALIGRCVIEDNRRIPPIQVSLVLIFLIRYLHSVFVTLV